MFGESKYPAASSILCIAFININMFLHFFLDEIPRYLLLFHFASFPGLFLILEKIRTVPTENYSI